MGKCTTHPHEKASRQRPPFSRAVLEEPDFCPITYDKAIRRFMSPSPWAAPSLLALVLMSKPTGSARPASFPALNHNPKTPFRPRSTPLDASFRTVWRYGRAENPEKLVGTESEHQAASLTSIRGEALQDKVIAGAEPETELQGWGVRLGYEKPSGILPRGLIVLCREQLDSSHSTAHASWGFHGGFPYPAAVMRRFDVSRKDWRAFVRDIDDVVRPYGTDRAPWFGRVKTGSDAKVDVLLERVLDVVALWDRCFFRPRGLMVRLDCPGEAKFGLTTMDIWHKRTGGRGHVDNCRDALSQKVHNFENEDKTKDSPKLRHLLKLLERAFHSTRLVIDEVAIMDHIPTAYARGWLVWNASCHWALRLSAKSPPPTPLAPAPQNGRADRWPRSKHMYYEPFVGTAHCEAHEYWVSVPRRLRVGRYTSIYYTRERRWDYHARCAWVPRKESMDQRTGGFGSRAVMPADEGLEEVRDVRVVYWGAWVLQLLEEDGYFEMGERQIGRVWKRGLGGLGG